MAMSDYENGGALILNARWRALSDALPSLRRGPSYVLGVMSTMWVCS